MIRTETVKEYCLAYIYIKAGATAITASDIEDTRADEALCGWVTGLIEQLKSATLFSQFTAIFNEWFSGLVNMLNEDVETMLVNALPTSVTLTLTSGGWVAENGLYKQSVTVTNMNGTKSVMVTPNPETSTAYSASEVRCTGQRTNIREFTAVTKPTQTVKVDVIHMGV